MSNRDRDRREFATVWDEVRRHIDEVLTASAARIMAGTKHGSLTLNVRIVDDGQNIIVDVPNGPTHRFSVFPKP